MKKYYCPYCGEPTFSSYQKYTNKYSKFGIRETLFFTCRNCHNEIERKYTYKDKRIKYLTLSCFLFIILMLVFTSIKAYILTAIALVCLTISGFFQDYYIGKACVLTRIDGNYNDNLYPAKISSKKVINGGIYFLKPNSEELTKTNVNRDYIAEIIINDNSEHFIRIIKPVDASPPAFAFEIFEDEKLIGNGEALKQ